jgi:hypothetical protein
MEMIQIAGLGGQRNTLKWWEFLMRRERKFMCYTSVEGLKIGGEVVAAMQIHYLGISFVDCWGTDSMKCPLLR